MGTNYYLKNKVEVVESILDYKNNCEGLHIGKSSAGWTFSLHVIPEEGINDLSDWIKRWSNPDTVIKDEYGRTVSTDEMFKIITVRENSQRKLPEGYNDWNHFHYRNQSERGPNGLVRHTIGFYCVGQGAGTWDLILGEFS